jgi:hypothetical protein
MYDFRLETQRDVAVYVSTLFTLMQDAYQHGALDACRFLRSKLAGMVPADALTAFVDGLPEPAPVEPPPAPAPAPAPEPKPEPRNAPRVLGEYTIGPNNTVRRVPTQSATLTW